MDWGSHRMPTNQFISAWALEIDSGLYFGIGFLGVLCEMSPTILAKVELFK